MGQGLYEKAPPTGYKEAADEWLNTDVLFNEVSFAYERRFQDSGPPSVLDLIPVVD